MLFMIGVMTVQIVRLYDKNEELKKTEENLEASVESEREKGEHLKEQEKYRQTDEYVESEASQKLGLTHDNWIIFRQKED